MNILKRVFDIPHFPLRLLNFTTIFSKRISRISLLIIAPLHWQGRNLLGPRFSGFDNFRRRVTGKNNRKFMFFFENANGTLSDLSSLISLLWHRKAAEAMI